MFWSYVLLRFEVMFGAWLCSVIKSCLGPGFAPFEKHVLRATIFVIGVMFRTSFLGLYSAFFICYGLLCFMGYSQPLSFQFDQTGGGVSCEIGGARTPLPCHIWSGIFF